MDHALDISVLHASSQPADEEICGAEETRMVLDWLEAFRTDADRSLAIDEGFALWAQYAASGDQNHGLLVLQEKCDRDRLRLIPVRQSVDGSVIVVPLWDYLDPDRRRVVAVAQHRPLEISVVNATHENWHSSRMPEDREGLRVDQILSDWLDERCRPAVERQLAYFSPPNQLEGTLAVAVRVGAGTNHRMAWEDDRRRYEFDRQHNTVEVYALGTGEWLHEARLDGTILKETGGEGRYWGKS